MVAFTTLSALASPIYYSFQGPVGFSNAPGIATGQTVHYVFTVDQDLNGYYTYNGASVPQTDYVYGGNLVDYFASDAVGGDIIATDNPNPPYAYEWHYGYSYLYAGSKYSYLSGSNNDPSGIDAVWVDGSGFLLDEWQVGQTFQGSNTTYSDAGLLEVNSTLTLTAISPENPLLAGAVPEPATLALFGAGILGLGLLARKPRKD
jgi:hypothetical protein